MKYRVVLTKYEVFEIEALNPAEALEEAYDRCDQDPYAWSDPVADFSVKEIK